MGRAEREEAARARKEAGRERQLAFARSLAARRGAKAMPGAPENKDMGGPEAAKMEPVGGAGSVLVRRKGAKAKDADAPTPVADALSGKKAEP